MNTKHKIEIDLHEAKKSIDDICIIGAMVKNKATKQKLAELNVYLQDIWAKVLNEHSKQLNKQP